MPEHIYSNVVSYGNQILYRGWDGQGNRIQNKPSFEPSLYISCSEDTGYKSLNGDNVKKVTLNNVKEYRDTLKRYDGVSGVSIFGDINLEIQFINKEYPDKIEYDYSLLNVAYIDIETTCDQGFPDVDDPEEYVIAITVKCKDRVVSLGVREFNVDGAECRAYESEEDLLLAFLDIWHEIDPDIVTGWNVRFFDIPYLYNRMRRVLGDKKARRLSPWSIVKEITVHRRNKEQRIHDLAGIATLDYLDLYSTFTYVNQESYSLSHISHVELGESKVSYQEYGSIREFYKNDFQKFMEYNVKDVLLVSQLEDKLRLMELAVALAYAAKVNIGDVFSQVKMWDGIIYHYLDGKNIAIPPRKITQKSEQYAGAFVKDPIVGMHGWVMSFDLNSLYPHLIMQYNISPETLVDFDYGNYHNISVNGILEEKEECLRSIGERKRNGLSVAANGTCYRTDVQGFLPALMENLYQERKIAKKNMIEAQKKKEVMLKSGALGADVRSQIVDLDKQISKYQNEQLVRKVQLNSAYGAIGNGYCRYYDVELAEAVTLSGQLSIRWIERELNKFMNEACGTVDKDYVIAIDTDSVYLNMEPIVQKIAKGKPKGKVADLLDKASDQMILPYIEQKYQEMADLVNAYQQKMKMGREVIADKGIWTAKKRYILNVLDSEGVRYDSPKIKVVGIETTRASTPEAVRKYLTQTIRLILDTDEASVIDHIEETRLQFSLLKPDEMAFPRGIRGMVKYADKNTIYKKHTPIATKGALVYNHLIKTMGLDKERELIRDDDKAKFIYLKVPNPVKERVITFPGDMPEEFDLEGYIDIDLQFEKAFLDPLKSILNSIGWQHERKSNLEGLFA